MSALSEPTAPLCCLGFFGSGTSCLFTSLSCPAFMCLIWFFRQSQFGRARIGEGSWLDADPHKRAKVLLKEGIPARPQRPSTCGFCWASRREAVVAPVRLVVNDDQSLIRAVIQSESHRRGRSDCRYRSNGRQGGMALLATDATGRLGALRLSGLTTRRPHEPTSST